MSECQQCGACCAAFRVSFHHSELESAGGRVPDGLADPETATTWRMRGTDYTPPRCRALVGSIGRQVACGIYAERPSPCREFAPLAAVGVYVEACDRARAAHGLPSLCRL